MKLFLSSSGLSSPQLREELLVFIGKPKNTIRSIFIPTAADPEPHKDFVISARSELGEISGSMVEVDLKTATYPELSTLFNETDVVFVNGGNTFYLLHWARESGFTQAIQEFVTRGGIYAGCSAGSILASPTVELAGWKGFDDPRVVELDSLEALSLVPYHIFVHYDPRWDSLIAANRPSLTGDLVVLADNEALFVEGSTRRHFKSS